MSAQYRPPGRPDVKLDAAQAVGMSRRRKAPAKAPQVVIRRSMADAVALYEEQKPMHPGNVLGPLPGVEVWIYPDLLQDTPGPLPPEIRAAVVEALTEGLVSAYRRQKVDLASQGRSSIPWKQGGTPQ